MTKYIKTSLANSNKTKFCCQIQIAKLQRGQMIPYSWARRTRTADFHNVNVTRNAVITLLRYFQGIYLAD